MPQTPIYTPQSHGLPLSPPAGWPRTAHAILGYAPTELGGRVGEQERWVDGVGWNSTGVTSEVRKEKIEKAGMKMEIKRGSTSSDICVYEGERHLHH